MVCERGACGLLGLGLGGMKSYTGQGYPAAHIDAVANLFQWNSCLSTEFRGAEFQKHGHTFIVLWGLRI
jgi:hypothetical protein